MKTQKINHAAVWVSVIIFQALSVLWYSPVLFAGKWMNYLGKTFDDFKGESISGLLYSLLGAVAFCYFLSWLFRKLGVDSGIRGVQLSVVIGITCFVLQTFTQDSFSLRPPGLSLINCGSVLINFCFAGFLLGSWKRYSVK